MVYTAKWVITCYLPPIKGTRNLHWSWINTRFHDSLHRCWHLRGVGHSRFSFCRWHPEGWYPWHTLLETDIAIEKEPFSEGIFIQPSIFRGYLSLKRGIFRHRKKGREFPNCLACCEQIPLNTFLRICVKGPPNNFLRLGIYRNQTSPHSVFGGFWKTRDTNKRKTTSLFFKK